MGGAEREEPWRLLRAGMVFVDVGLQSFAIAISPFLLHSNADEDDPSTVQVLTWLGLLTAVFYLGRGVTKLIVPNINNQPSIPSFVLVFSLAFVVILFYGWVETIGSLIIIRLFHGVLAAIASAMTDSSMPTTAGHLFWFTGFALGPIITGLFYADGNNVINPSLHSNQSQPALYSCLIFGIAVLLTGFFMLCFVRNNVNEADNCYEPLRGGSPHTSTVKPSVSMTPNAQKTAAGEYITGQDCESKDSVLDVKSELSSDPMYSTIPGARLSAKETEIPARFIRGCGGSMQQAQKRWQTTLAWRAENNVDSVLNEAQPDFQTIKQCYPHFFHGVDKVGHPVYYEQLGKIDTARLKENGVTVERLLRYYVFLTEYIWNEVEPNPNGQLVTVLDMENVGLKGLGGDALDFFKQASKIVQEHYMERCHKMFLINVPYMFSFIWKIVQPMVNENTRRKITILSSDYSKLQNAIDTSQLPKQYGGSGPSLGEAEQEYAYRNFVAVLNNGELPAYRGYTDKDFAKRMLSVRSELSEPDSKYSDIDGSVSTDYRQFTNDIPRQADCSHKEDEDEDKVPDDADVAGGSNFFTRTLFAGFTSVQNAVSELGDTVVTASKRVGDKVKDVIDNGIPFQQAHLGLENRYVYDEEKRMWVLQDVSSEEVYDETEARLVRAILAAQGHDGEDGTSELDEEAQEIVLQSSVLEDPRGTDGAIPPTPMEQDRRGRLMLSALYILWRMMLVCSLESAAAVMYVPDSEGGLAFTATQIALVYAIASLILMLCQVSRSRCAVRKARYPLQVLRWAAAGQLPAFALLIGVTYTTNSSDGVVLFRMVVLMLCVAVLLGGLLAASVGTIAISAVAEWPRLSGVVMLMEAVGACVGPLLMARSLRNSKGDDEDSATVPYFFCFGLTILSLFLSCTVPAYWNKTALTKGGFQVQQSS